MWWADEEKPSLDPPYERDETDICVSVWGGGGEMESCSLLN